MITAYRKPLDPSTLVIEIEGEDDALALHGYLVESSGPRDRVWGAVTRHLEAFLARQEMSPEAENGPYRAEQAREGWLVSIGGWGIGHSFAKESLAREAAATLNEFVKLDRKV